MSLRIVQRMLWAAATALCLRTGPAAAQIRGQVVDQSEHPIAEALVELWASSRRVEATRTDNQGHFQIPSGPENGERMLTVRRLGLATQTVALALRDTTLHVVMKVQAVSLQPLVVEASAGRLCPRPEDPRARDVWTRMRSRYWQPGAETVSIFAFIELRSGTGQKADVFEPSAGRTSAWWTNDALVLAHPEIMALSGYATRASGGVGERTAFWDYRALDDVAMQDFTSDYFGAVHTFSLISQSNDRMVIGFCPRERLGERGQIQGTLALRSDTTMSSARWTFRTRGPDEDAGGEATYLPPDQALGRALLAQESAFWRKSGRGYYYEVKAFSGWRRVGGASAHR